VIGLMEDAGYVLFSEMARDAGVGLLVQGQHRQACDAASRHALNSVAGWHGVADILAAGLAREGGSFAVTELPLGASGRPFAGRNWSSLGFVSYQTDDEQPFWLHLAGVSLADGCAALDIDPGRIRPRVCWTRAGREAAVNADWTALLGQALCHLGSGGEMDAPCIAQAFLRHEAAPTEPGKPLSLVSFVMDV